MIFIPDNPPIRSYACPKCHKGVRCFRVGESSQYVVMDAADEKQEHGCGYEGAIENKLLGYKPNGNPPKKV